MKPPRLERVGRWVFLAYALVLVTLTHWPGLTIEGPVPRPDLFVHAGAFGLWTLLLAASGLIGPLSHPLLALRACIVGLAWSGFDEWSQRFFSRFSTWDDYAANAVGVGLATLVIAGLPLIGRSLAPEAR